MTPFEKMIKIQNLILALKLDLITWFQYLEKMRHIE